MGNMHAKSLTNSSGSGSSTGTGLLSIPLIWRHRQNSSRHRKKKTLGRSQRTAFLSSQPTSKTAKARFYGSVLAIYAATLMFASYISPVNIFKQSPTPSQLAAAQLPPPPPPPPQVISGRPVRISVPRLGINLPVEDGHYNSITGKWTLSDANAHYATPSMPPNDHQGNTLVYAHNHDMVFGLLRNAQVDDVAEIFTENGRKFVYKFTRSENVTPETTNVFQYQGVPTLVLQTCTGNWNETRGLYYFKFEKVE